MPPRQCFIDTWHYAAMLAYLDAYDLLISAGSMPNTPVRVFVLGTARMQTEKVQKYLRESTVFLRVAPEYGLRAEYHPSKLAREARDLRLRILEEIDRGCVDEWILSLGLPGFQLEESPCL